MQGSKAGFGPMPHDLEGNWNLNFPSNEQCSPTPAAILTVCYCYCPYNPVLEEKVYAGTIKDRIAQNHW